MVIVFYKPSLKIGQESEFLVWHNIVHDNYSEYTRLNVQSYKRESQSRNSMSNLPFLQIVVPYLKTIM